MRLISVKISAVLAAMPAAVLPTALAALLALSSATATAATAPAAATASAAAATPRCILKNHEASRSQQAVPYRSVRIRPS